MDKKILLFLFFIFNNCLAQIPIYPEKDSTVNLSNSSGDVLWFTYSPVIKDGNIFKLYYISGGVPKVATSLTGMNWGFEEVVNSARAETILKKDSMWYMGYHATKNGSVYFHTCQSSDGITFTADSQRFKSGDDITLTMNYDTFYCYVRPKIPNLDPQRKIGLSKSSDFSHWSPVKTILAVDSADYINPASPDFRKQFYAMSVFKNGDDWWGLLSVLRVGDHGEDVEQPPPYTALEHTVETQLVYSTDGEHWMRTNNRQAFIPRTGGMMEIFGLPTIVDDELWIYSIETKRRHTTFDYSNVNGRYFGIWRYKISLEDLETWKPATYINLAMAVEGLINPAGVHNSKDSATIYLRDTYYPYSIVDSAVGVIDSVSLEANFALKKVRTGSYYLAVSGKNFIETWSNVPVTINEFQWNIIDFTSDISAAYGNNLVLKHGKYCLYSGDVDKNGIIELVDVLNTFNDARSFTSDGNLTDLNGDGIVDLADLNIVSNNANDFIVSQRPSE